MHVIHDISFFSKSDQQIYCLQFCTSLLSTHQRTNLQSGQFKLLNKRNNWGDSSVTGISDRYFRQITSNAFHICPVHITIFILQSFILFFSILASANKRPELLTYTDKAHIVHPQRNGPIQYRNLMNCQTVLSWFYQKQNSIKHV